MGISLTYDQIVAALPKVGSGLQKYLWLQERVGDGDDFCLDRTFRRRFNGLYRVRRGPEWQEHFFQLMGRARRWPFPRVLEELSTSTGRLEVSFASKLVASLDPGQPVIDSFVLKNVGLRLPPAGSADRSRKACEVHAALCNSYSAFLATDSGHALVAEFRRHYPAARVTALKMVDLVLWQTRE